MLIQVVYADKKIGVVAQDTLDRLIEHKAIAAFRRLDAWVIIGKDRIRKTGRFYDGPERRTSGMGADLRGQSSRPNHSITPRNTHSGKPLGENRFSDKI
ncbi:hypothetical protein OR1_01156 [Geobacter sp. OR-1]|uniref:GSU3473 family protein n=1 Tax=Geobacter sp. OR-1 TaxID=1266765 RepID=UPI0005434C21|nr:hypothetical protein OR1_01156 [Geobacter sp. OR-1]